MKMETCQLIMIFTNLSNPMTHTHPVRYPAGSPDARQGVAQKMAGAAHCGMASDLHTDDPSVNFRTRPLNSGALHTLHRKHLQNYRRSSAVDGLRSTSDSVH